MNGASAIGGAPPAGAALPMPPPSSLYGLAPSEVEEAIRPLGLPSYRTRQVCRWIYRRDVASFDEMTDLARPLRDTLSTRYTLERPAIAHVAPAADGSRKYDIRLADGLSIECVLIAGGRRPSLCLSSQVGCALACTFCRTGDMGLLRHLRHEEIVAQVSLVRREAGLSGTPCSYVFMGMGEPLHNASEVCRALEVMTHPDGFAISPRRITVSTAGYLPGLGELVACGIPVKIALSVTTVDPALRDQLVPINRRHPLPEVLHALERFPRRRGRRITIAYCLIAGVNDAPEDAVALARAVRAIPVKVNLIPWNPYPGSPYRRPDEVAVERFRERISASGLLATVRKTHGDDVLGACGQLASAGRPSRAR